MTSPLEDWSFGRLLSTAARMVEREWNAWLGDHDLTHAGFLALHSLAAGPLPQRELAAASHVEEQTMARVVDRLERTGHVTRGRDPRDRRRVLVERTVRGVRAHAAVQDSQVADWLVRDSVEDPDRFRAELVRLVTRSAVGETRSARRPGADRLPRHSVDGEVGGAAADRDGGQAALRATPR